MEKGINTLQLSNSAEMAGGSVKLKVAVRKMLLFCVLTQKLRMERLPGARSQQVCTGPCEVQPRALRCQGLMLFMKELFLSFSYSEAFVISVSYNHWEYLLILTWHCFARAIALCPQHLRQCLAANRCSVNAGVRKGWSREETALRKVGEMTCRLPSLKAQSPPS